LTAPRRSFGLSLGHRRYVAAYQAIEMRFLGRLTSDPVECLQSVADLRHRLVHSAGRADARLLAEYPDSGLIEGAPIELPFGIPFRIHFLFVPFTEILDEAFSGKFGWERPTTAVEQLISPDLRVS